MGVWGWVIFSYPVSYPVPHVVSSTQINWVTFGSIDTRPPDLHSESIQFDCTPYLTLSQKDCLNTSIFEIDNQPHPIQIRLSVLVVCRIQSIESNI